MRYAPAIIVGRSVRTLARLRKPGGGSAVPGLVVNSLAPGYLARTLSSFPDGLIVVTGSSGKSTTTKMLVAALRAHGKRVFTNPSTANIAQGLTSALLEVADLRGRVLGDIAVLEMDEGHGARLAKSLSPRLVLLTNVMVDQIDRFHDSEMVAGMLATIASRATQTVVLNADDGYLAGLADSIDVGIERFGVTADVLAAAEHGLGHARLADERLAADGGTVVAGVTGRTATILIDGRPHEVALPARGVHYATDAAAALSATRSILGEAFDAPTAIAAIGSIPPVFGRGEIVEVRGQHVEFVLVQNPASFQLNVDTLEPGSPMLFAIGSDVRDPSYFWPVDTSRVGRVQIVSGSKAYALALQLIYDGVTVERIEPDLGRAIDDFLAAPAPESGMKTIVFSADSMRRTRAHLGLTGAQEDA